MADEFDPYYIWLGIPPEEQPADHYRLLGVRHFEDNADVIAHAADRQMAHVKSLATGQHIELSQKILNELAAAKICLLNTEKKAAYDGQLRQSATAAAATAATTDTARSPRRRRRAPKAGAEKPKATPVRPATSEPEPAGPKIVALAEDGGIAGRYAARQKTTATRPAWQLPAAIGGGAAVLLVIVLVVFLSRGGDKPAGGGTRRSARLQKPVAEKEKKPAPVEEPPIVEKPPAEKPPIQKPATEKPAGDKQDASQPSVAPPKTDSPAAVPDRFNLPPPVEQPAAALVRVEKQIDKPPPAPPVARPPEKPAAPAGLQLPPPRDEIKVQKPAAAEPADQRLAVPEVDRQKAAWEEIRKIYDVDKAGKKSDKLALAERLLADAAGTKDPANRFVLLRIAGNLAAQAGNADAALAAVEQMARRFKIDVPKTKAAALAKVFKATTTKEGHRALNSRFAAILDEAVATDDYKLAAQVGRLLVATALRTKDRSLQRQSRDRVKEIDEIAKQHEKAKPAFETLKEQPDDADAGLAAGRFLCLAKGDWDRGLPLLANAPGSELGDLAVREQKNPDTADEQVALGDDWWTQATTEKGAAKANLQSRAAHWYRRVLPGLPGGLAKTKIQKRLAEIDPGGKAGVAKGRPRHVPADAVAFGGHWYKKFMDTRVFWIDAAKKCRAVGGHLVTIQSAREQQFLEKFTAAGKAGAANYWIGLRHDGKRWAWVDGTAPSFLAWHPAPTVPGQLLSKGHTVCFQSRKSGKWIPDPPTTKMMFLCEWDPAGPPKWPLPELSDTERNTRRKKPMPPRRAKPVRAEIIVTCDDSYSLFHNGRHLSQQGSWTTVEKYRIAIRKGDVIAVVGTDNTNGAKSAGLFCTIRTVDGRVFPSGTGWVCAAAAGADWMTTPGVAGFGPISTQNVHPWHRTRKYPAPGAFKGVNVAPGFPHAPGSFMWSPANVKTVHFKFVVP